MQTLGRSRPLGITIIAIIVGIYGILGIIGGIGLLTGGVTILGLITLILGVLDLSSRGDYGHCSPGHSGQQ